ncbi:TPA: DNA primase, partial [Klebsiella pneumoniae]
MTMSDLKELLSELDFEQWLDMEGIIYRRGGVSARGREVNIKECPVCGSTNWKVYFNLTNNVGKCFAGDHPEEIQFNKLVFLKHYSGKSRRAFEEYVHNALLSQGWAPKKEEVVLASAVELEGPVALPRHYELPIDGRLPDYLVERNITPELAKYFDLRYCVEGKHAYVDPYTDQVKGQAFDMRILIPIYDLNGVMKTFQGRDVTGAAERRYLFPMQLPASGRFLYNGHNAVGKQTVVVCEGAFDVMGVKRAIFDEETLRDYV